MQSASPQRNSAEKAPEAGPSGEGPEKAHLGEGPEKARLGEGSPGRPGCPPTPGGTVESGAVQSCPAHLVTERSLEPRTRLPWAWAPLGVMHPSAGVHLAVGAPLAQGSVSTLRWPRPHTLTSPSPPGPPGPPSARWPGALAACQPVATLCRLPGCRRLLGLLPPLLFQLLFLGG